MANTLVRASQSLNLSEKRIMMAAIAKMAGVSTGEVKITAEEYANSFDLPIKQAYDQLKEAAENIYQRSISLSKEDSKGKIHTKFRWIAGYKYHDGMGFISLGFTNYVIPYLVDLQEQFTKYRLQQAGALRSIYSWRLLELLTQQSSGWLLISIEDFHHAMDTPKSRRNNFGRLRIDVIEPAVNELRNKDGWLIEWLPIKSGRKVTQLRFDFKKDPQGKLDI